MEEVVKSHLSVMWLFGQYFRSAFYGIKVPLALWKNWAAE